MPPNEPNVTYVATAFPSTTDPQFGFQVQ